MELTLKLGPTIRTPVEALVEALADELGPRFVIFPCAMFWLPSSTAEPCPSSASIRSGNKPAANAWAPDNRAPPEDDGTAPDE